MTLVYFLEGILIGFLVAAPIGPAGVICIRRTLAYSRQEGVTVGLGAAAADLVFAGVAAFGVTLISGFVNTHQQEFRLVGGALLVTVGLFFSVRAKTAGHPRGIKANEHAVFWGIFFMGLTNPMPLLAYAAAFTIAGVKGAFDSSLDPLLLVGGVFLGSFLWFLLLTLSSFSFKETMTGASVVIVNKAAAGLLIVLGILALWRGTG